ncbi:MAG: zinc ribbon domain-containing protein [Deltaproteobacteria bacterium]|nr:zinc ribbon domain-containing protein [Deltaproteobacteria bacterium]
MPTDAALPLPACARCRAALELDDLRCPICSLATPTVTRASAKPLVTRVRCKGCHAAVNYSAEVQAPKCAYCGSLTEIETPEDPVEQAQAYLPFRIAPDAAQAALQSFLSRKSLFRPGDLARSSTLAETKALWWPAWVCNAHARVSWTADSEAGSHRADWAPHSGQTDLVFRDLLVSASRGLSEEECRLLATGYDLSVADPSPKGLQGAMVEQFDVSRSGARRAVHEALERSAEREARREVPGSRCRNLHIAAMLTGLDTVRYALPAYVFAYRYGKKLHRVVVHGQAPAMVLGKAPVSAWRVLLAVAGGLLLAALAGAAVALLKR